MPGRGAYWREGGLPDSSVTGADIKNLSVDTSDIADDAVWGTKIDAFKSTEITGTGSEQNIAHGLGRTPTFVWWSITQQGDTDTVVEGTHDATNVKLNFPATTKLKVIAV